MQNFKASILSTRPISDALIQQAASENILIDVLSFIKTEAIDSIEVYEEIENILTESAIVVFTSMNAVEVVAAHIDEYKPDWTIYCIGNTTKKLVKEYFGEELIASTADDATALANEIIEDGTADEVVFFCGDKRRDELPSVLNNNGIDVNEIEVYQTNMIEHKLDETYNGILFFSPSAAESFFTNNTLNDTTILFAIGNTTATTIKQFTSNKIIIADEPGKSNLVEKAISYFS